MTSSQFGLVLERRPLALLLDAGDTLIFFDAQAVSIELGRQGHAIAPEQLDAVLHESKRRYQAQLSSGASHADGWTILMQSLLTLAGMSQTVAEQALPALRAAHDDFYFWRRVPAELPAALDRARAGGIRLGVVSNSEGRLSSVLERVGLMDKLELVVDSHLEGVQKPDPEIFRRALARLGPECADAPERVVYAGDIPEVDVFGARGAGMHGVLVDAFDLYADRRDVARVPSVAALCDALLALPV
jgi:putative hydrolase of the HAD superfamily